MTQIPVTAPVSRSIWVRALMMVLMAVAFQLASTLLCLLAVLQWIITLVTQQPNARLSRLGRNLGEFLRQIAAFVSFDTEAAPFPFSDWPQAG